MRGHCFIRQRRVVRDSSQMQSRAPSAAKRRRRYVARDYSTGLELSRWDAERFANEFNFLLDTRSPRTALEPQIDSPSRPSGGIPPFVWLISSSSFSFCERRGAGRNKVAAGCIPITIIIPPGGFGGGPAGVDVALARGGVAGGGGFGGVSVGGGFGGGGERRIELGPSEMRTVGRYRATGNEGLES